MRKSAIVNHLVWIFLEISSNQFEIRLRCWFQNKCARFCFNLIETAFHLSEISIHSWHLIVYGWTRRHRIFTENNRLYDWVSSNTCLFLNFGYHLLAIIFAVTRKNYIVTELAAFNRTPWSNLTFIVYCEHRMTFPLHTQTFCMSKNIAVEITFIFESIFIQFSTACQWLQ